MFQKTSKNSGFSVAELLLVLLTLSVIVTYSIPKVIAASASNQKKAIYRDLITSVAAILYQGRVESAYTESTTSSVTSPTVCSYLLERLNAKKICTGNAVTQGCWTQNLNGGAASNFYGGAAMHDGATLLCNAAFCYSGSCSNGVIAQIFFDWDGPNGNNVYGDDQAYIFYSVGKVRMTSSPALSPGRFSATAPSSTILDEVF